MHSILLTPFNFYIKEIFIVLCVIRGGDAEVHLIGGKTFIMDNVVGREQGGDGWFYFLVHMEE